MTELLEIPSRATEHVDLAGGLAYLIESEFNRNPTMFKESIDAVSQLRSQIFDGTLDSLLDYYNALSVIIPKFPYDIGVELPWYNALGYSNSLVKNPSLIFDKINVVYNIGAKYTKIAISQTDVKQSFNSFRQAAGVYRFLIDTVLVEFQQPLPLELTPQCLEALYWLCLAQAQEMFWQRALADKLKNATIAKLAWQVSELYGKCLECATKTSALKSEYVSHVTCKRYHFEAAAHFRAASAALEKNQHGAEVARLEAAVESAKTGLAKSRYASGKLIDDLRTLHSRAQTDLSRSERDNNMIYLQMVPTRASLPSLGGSSSSYPTATMPNFGQGEPKLFDQLYPYAVSQAVRVYTQKLSKYVQSNVVNKVEALNVEMYACLERLQLPGTIEALERPQGIPHVILVHSQEIRDQGGVAQLKDSFSRVGTLAEMCQEAVSKARSALESESRTSEKYQSQYEGWTLPASREAGAGLWEELEQLEYYLKTTRDTDEIVRDKFRKTEYLLEVLDSGDVIQEYIPHSTTSELSEPLSICISRIRESLGEWTKTEQTRRHKVAELKQQVESIDLSHLILSHYSEVVSGSRSPATVADFEPVYHSVLSQFDRDLLWVEQQGPQQKNLMAALGSRAESLMQIREIDSKLELRKEAIQGLEQAYFKYTEIKYNLEEGRNFYNEFLAKAQDLAERCSEFCTTRRQSAERLEQQIQNAIVAGDRGDESNEPSEPKIQAPQARSAINVNTWTPKSGIKFS